MADTQPLAPCGECGMPCAANEYHPYAACLMFKACHNSEVVRANLEAVHGKPVPASAAEFALRALVAAGHVTQERVDQALALPGAPAQPVVPVVPAGYALVPVEPTPEMLSVMWVNKNSSLSEAYNSLSEAYSAMLAASPQPVVREPLTRQQLREAFHKDTGCTLGGDIDLAERVCGVVERAHGITTNSRKDGP